MADIQGSYHPLVHRRVDVGCTVEQKDQLLSGIRS